MRIKLLRALAILACLSACSPPLTEEELLDRAAAALAERDAEAALVDIKSALKENTGSARARILYGKVYLFQQDPAAALSEFERGVDAGAGSEGRLLLAKALVLTGDTAELLSRHEAGEFAGLVADDEFRAVLARAYLAQGEFAEARQALGSIKGSGSDYTDITRAIITIQLDKEIESGRAILEDVVARSADNGFAWSLLGTLATSDGDYARASEAYQRAADTNPYRLADRLRLADSRMRAGDREAADRELRGLERVIPEAPQVHFLRGQLAFDDGEYREAMDAFSRVLGSLPDHTGALLMSGIANAREGNLVTAQRQLSKFHAQQPAHVEGALQLARVWLELGEPGNAEAVAREVLEEDEMNVKALGLLAIALSTQGMHAESAAAYKEIATLRPDSPEALMGAGVQGIISGEDAGAISDLEAAVAMSPESTIARERLIGAYLAVKDMEAAQAAAEDYLAAFPASPRPAVLLGRLKLQSGDAGAANALFKQALEIDPEDINASAGLAAVEILSGDLQRAREIFEGVLDSHPGNVETSINLAAVLERQGDRGAMREVLEEALAKNEQALAPRLILARIALAEDRAGDALELLRGVADDDGANPEFLQLLATTYLENGQRELAADTAQQFLELDPQQPAALAVSARVELASGRPGLAEEYLEKALGVAPSDQGLRKQYIDVLVAQNKLDEARESISELPPSVQQETAMLVLRGRLAMAANDFAAARLLLRQAFEQQRSNANLLLLSEARWALGERDDTLAELSAWLERNPQDGIARNYLATKYLLSGDESAALDQYQRLAEQEPESVIALNNLAWLLREKDLPRAIEYIDRARELAPGSVAVDDTYAMVLLEEGDIEEALAVNSRILADQPDNPELRLHRAQILARGGRKQEAIELLEALATEPDHPGKEEARALLDSLRAAAG